MSQKVHFWSPEIRAKGPEKMAVDPVRGVWECLEMSQMKAETKILIYKLVLVAKIYALSLQKKLKNLGGQKCPPPGMEG